MIEIYKDIKDLEGKYQVSNIGRVKSLNYGRSGKSKLLQPIKDKEGYLFVNLYKDGKLKGFKVHRLVAETFLPNANDLPQVNQIDEDKTNNFVFLNEDGSINKEKSNLEWKTPKENSNHGTRNQRIFEKTTNGKCSKKVLQFTLDGEFICEWPSTQECGRNGFGQRHVSACCRGERKSHKGYIWKYKE